MFESISFQYFFNSSFLLSILIVLFCLWVKFELCYWKRREVFSPPANFLIGHLGPVLTRNESLGIRINKLYRQTREQKFVGLYLFLEKTLLINDLELVKLVLTKDFDHFSTHGTLKDKELDPLGQHLFHLEGEEWKRIRVNWTPTFTSSKMKYMFDSMLTCSDDMISYMKNIAKLQDKIDVKEVIAKFGTDVIASCAFGIQTNSFKYPDAEFRRMGKKIFESTSVKMMVDLWTHFYPKSVPSFLSKYYMKDAIEFFPRIVRETIELRKKNKISRSDFLQLLIDMKNSDEKSGMHLTMDEIVAQVFGFFIAGFETSSTTATYVFYELAKNQDIQDKARQQIDQALEGNGDKITYELIKDLNYLTYIVEESLRMYPPLAFLVRKCTKDYVIPDTKCRIVKDTLVLIPVLGIQMDPEIYPDPEKFNPDRFTPEKVAERHHFSHLPFGEGPRMCIGSRFAMMLVKLALFVILRNFNVDLVEESSGPLKFDPKSFLLQTEGPMLLKFTRR